jgi:exopolysaccharide production protein ExoQ
MSLSIGSERKGLRWCYVASVLFFLQAMSAFGFVDELVYGQWDYKGGDKITQGLNALMILISLLLFWRAFRRKMIGTGGVLALALVSFLALSAVWSVDPQTTLRHVVLYFFIIIGTIGVVGSSNEDEAMESLRIACNLSVAASIMLLFISPSHALMPMSSDMRGVFPHKNMLGEVMAIGVLATLHNMRVNGSRSLRKMFMLIAFIVVALLSKSATAVLTTISFCAVSGIIVLFHNGGIARVVGTFVLLFLIPIAVIVALNNDAVLDLLGKDQTLTGRTELWSLVLRDINERWMLGWGFSAFWSPTNPAANEISETVRWTVPQAHNGLLEMLLEVGIVGTSMFVLIWARNVGLALFNITTSASNWAISSLLCCLGVLLIGTTEPVLVDPTHILTSAFFMTGLLCERMMWASRDRRFEPRLRPIRVF